MKRRSLYYELILKTLYFVLSFFVAIYIFSSLISMIPLLGAFKITDEELYTRFFHTDVGIIFTNMNVLEDTKFSIMFKEAYYAFLINFKWIDYAFLFMFSILLFGNFIYPKWNFVKQYIKINSFIILLYIGRYLLFAAAVSILFKSSTIELTRGIFVGALLYIISSLGIIFFLSLLMIKFIFNVYFDIKHLIAINDHL